MIELENVSKKFGNSVTAVEDLSLRIEKGEIFGLIGSSGCGKTTTLKMINRLEEPTSGSITINGAPVHEKPAEQLRRSIGYVIQNVGLFPHYSVEQNIAITPQLMHWKKDKIATRSREMLQLVGLEPDQFARRMPAQLSGGQQQRVGLARALAADPPVILMDEPFGALDPITKERIQKEFKKLLQQIHKTIVLVTHDVFEAFTLCGRVCLMDGGRAQQTGTPRELLFQPANNFVKSFFDNHRFQLEMISITVEDILEMVQFKPKEQKSSSLKAEEGLDDSRTDDQIIAVNDSFFTVIEGAYSENEKFTIISEEGEQLGFIMADELLKGFQAVRSKLKEERDG